MTSIVRLEALSGVKDDGPLCYLLQVDDSCILLDCGWDEKFDMIYIEAVKQRIPQINAVLLTFADPAHLGALPYLVAKCGLTAPVYATGPVYKMGQMFLYDWINSHMNVEEFDLFSLDDVDAAFERVQQVKYNQTVLLKGETGLQVTPLPAGHMIGGAFWRISKMGDDEIVYAVDFNHKKERHLNGCLFDAIQRPHLLITDAFNAQYKQPSRKQRDEKLVTKMLRTLREGGDCLVVIDTAGRVLEIAHLLDQIWNTPESGLATYNLVMLSHVASSVVEFAKSQVEWMSDKILKSFESGRYNPFQFKYVQLCHSQMELSRIRSPKVVLCSDLSMECGFSRELFLEWCSDTRNTIIVTGRSGDRTLGAKLIHMAEAAANGERTGARQLTLQIKRRIRLDGSELEAFRARKRKKEEEEEQRKRAEARSRNARLGRAGDSDSDSDDDEAIANAIAAVTGIVKKTNLQPNGTAQKATNASSSEDAKTGSNMGDSGVNGVWPSLSGMTLAASSHDVLIRWEQQQRTSFFKQNKKSFPMFPFAEEKSKWDDYGEVIRPEDYMIDSGMSSDNYRNALSKHEQGDGPELPAVLLPEEKEWPTKCIQSVTKLEVLCRVEFIEFEGRSDGESLKKILAQIRPKQLIIVHGSPQSTRHLAQYAMNSKCVLGKIFTPKLGEIIDATIESHIFQVKEAELSWLDAKLVRRVKDAQADEEEEEKEVEAEEEEEDDMLEGGEGDEENAATRRVSAGRNRLRRRKNVDKFLLDIVPSHAIPPHQAVFVNDPKLSDVKQQLILEGFQAEFTSGVLYINGVASIRRNEAGKFHVEGCASEEYYRIRDIIYNQFAIV